MGLWAVGTVRCCSRWGYPHSPSSFAPLLLLSFFLPQDDINETADEREREGHPGQHVRVAELRPFAVVRAHHGVDDCSAHHEHAWGGEGRGAVRV